MLPEICRDRIRVLRKRMQNMGQKATASSAAAAAAAAAAAPAAAAAFFRPGSKLGFCGQK